ncbi:pyridoxamine 5'-phosphate oxidase family protein [Candidatus Bathyarchaeota archaeon]|nr:pyridoxamine 5'-phosphate oxidase family protein [Candidatus Bathyarchaeota archaeon]
MVKVPEEIRKTFEKQRVIPFATASKNGIPNVALVGMWWWEDEETLVVVDNYLNKTKTNFMENPVAAFNGWADGKSYLVKGNVEYQTSGTLYEKVRIRATSGQRQFPGKAAVVIKITEVFQETGGENPGIKII